MLHLPPFPTPMPKTQSKVFIANKTRLSYQYIGLMSMFFNFLLSFNLSMTSRKYIFNIYVYTMFVTFMKLNVAYIIVLHCI